MADEWVPLATLVGYDETTMLQTVEMDEPFAHTDHNTLHRVD